MAKGNRGIKLDHHFYCVYCSKESYSIPRINGKERPAGHMKNLYCLFCKTETNHVECVPWSKYDYNDFLTEFNEHNFDKDGNRILTYGELRSKLNNEGRLYAE